MGLGLSVVRRTLLLIPLVVLVLAGAGVAGARLQHGWSRAAPTCPSAWLNTWQTLADKIKAPVYCPGWLPDPLTGDIGGRWNNINSVDKDRSYLMSFVWQETGGGAAGGELHVNLRGYPGRTAIPKCTRGGKDKQLIPCFADARGTIRENGIRATMYTVNQDADQWHVLLAWRHQGSLYTLSEHVAAPLTYSKVVSYLKHELRSLVRIEPTT